MKANSSRPTRVRGLRVVTLVVGKRFIFQGKNEPLFLHRLLGATEAPDGPTSLSVFRR